MEKTLYLSRIEPDLAAGLLVGSEHLDPTGQSAPGDVAAMTRRGQCFAATADKSQAVYVVNVCNGVAFISAMKGSGSTDWIATLLPVIEQQSKGLGTVAFQTKRRGLVRKAQRQGYRVAGYIMSKAIQ